MKAPQPKIHLLDSAEPLTEKQDQVAMCGAVVPKAVWAFMWDEDLTNSLYESLSQFSLCQDCRQLEFDHRYIYGILPGQESHTPTPQENA